MLIDIEHYIRIRHKRWRTGWLCEWWWEDHKQGGLLVTFPSYDQAKAYAQTLRAEYRIQSRRITPFFWP